MSDGEERGGSGAGHYVESRVVGLYDAATDDAEGEIVRDGLVGNDGRTRSVGGDLEYDITVENACHPVREIVPSVAGTVDVDVGDAERLLRAQVCKAACSRYERASKVHLLVKFERNFAERGDVVEEAFPHC